MLHTAGIVRLQCGWASEVEGGPVGPDVVGSQRRRPTSTTAASAGRFQVGADVDQWIERVQLDPNDPANADMFDRIEVIHHRICDHPAIDI